MKIFCLNLIAIVFFTCCQAASLSSELQTLEREQEVSHWSHVVRYAKQHLPQKGRLIQKSDGYAYLKVDNEYVFSLFPKLDLRQEGYRKPPYFRSHESPGAHISVVYKDENVILEEIGETFHFELNKIVIVRPNPRTSYAVLEVKSEELEKLREKYGLSPKLHGHEFHITLAKKIHRIFRPD